jgi:hypothetical protein
LSCILNIFLMVKSFKWVYAQRYPLCTLNITKAKTSYCWYVCILFQAWIVLFLKLFCLYLDSARESKYMLMLTVSDVTLCFF